MSKILRYDEIMSNAIANMVALQDKVTDFNEGSVIHTILDTVARLTERAYIAIRQGYNEMLCAIPYSLFGFEKKAGKKSTGTVVFYTDKITNKNITIQSSLKLSGGGFSFTTTQAGVIPAGSKESLSIAVICDTIGKSGNIEAGVIDTIDSTTDTSILGVLQEKAFTGGSDTETDAQAEHRFKAYLAGLSGTNCYAIETAVLNIQGVQKVATQNHKPPLQDLYNLSVYVDDGSSGNTDKDLLNNVYNVLCGAGTQENQGYLPPGINIRVVSPSAKNIDFIATVYVGSSSIDNAKFLVEKTVKQYIENLSIGGAFIIQQCVAKIMGLSFVKDVAVKQPTQNIDIAIDTVAKVGNITLDFMESD